MAEFAWDRTSDEDRQAFALALAPLVAASRTKSFTRAEALAYLTTLRDVPRDVFAEAVDRMLATGVTWMPKAGDIKAECAAVVKERRRVAAKKADEMKAECEQCNGTGWTSVFDDEGHERAKACWCAVRGKELLAAAGQPIALPPARETDGDAA